MQEKLTLVLGGARSGKSKFAEKYALHAGAKAAYIATAEILDKEMSNRVEYHKKRRANGRWLNFEAPYAAEKVMLEAGKLADVVLFDCLTIYISNLMYGKGAPADFNAKYDYVYAGIDKLLKAARTINKPVIFVANDVGAGIVPDSVMGREYRDIAGWVNQQVGREADEVYYVIAGNAVDIKKIAFKFKDENGENNSGRP